MVRKVFADVRDQLNAKEHELLKQIESDYELARMCILYVYLYTASTNFT
jgi:hypothetical protein